MPFPRGAYENISVPPVRRSRQRSPKATHRKERRTHLRDLSFNWLEPKWVNVPLFQVSRRPLVSYTTTGPSA
jgi:hypothetical protein